MKTYRGKERYRSTNSSAQNGDEWLSYPREGTPVLMKIGLDGPRRRFGCSGEELNFLSLPLFELWMTQPAAYRNASPAPYVCPYVD